MTNGHPYRAADLVTARVLPLHELRTHVLGFDELLRALDILQGKVPGEKSINVVVTPTFTQFVAWRRPRNLARGTGRLTSGRSPASANRKRSAQAAGMDRAPAGVVPLHRQLRPRTPRDPSVT